MIEVKSVNAKGPICAAPCQSPPRKARVPAVCSSPVRSSGAEDGRGSAFATSGIRRIRAMHRTGVRAVSEELVDPDRGQRPDPHVVAGEAEVESVEVRPDQPVAELAGQAQERRRGGPDGGSRGSAAPVEAG